MTAMQLSLFETHEHRKPQRATPPEPVTCGPSAEPLNAPMQGSVGAQPSDVRYLQPTSECLSGKSEEGADFLPAIASAPPLSKRAQRGGSRSCARQAPVGPAAKDACVSDGLVIAKATRLSVTNLEEARAAFDDAACDHSQRAQIRSAFTTIGRGLGLPLSQIPATPEQLRPLLSGATPSRAGIKPRNWTQVKSRAMGGLRHLGVEVVASRAGNPLSPEWARLWKLAPSRQHQLGLSRILRFLSRGDVRPEALTSTAFEDFRTELLERSLVSNPEQCLRRTAKLWNEAKAAVVVWPQVTLTASPDPRRYSLDWNAFPRSFVEEVEAFLHAKSNTDPLADDFSKSTRSATTQGRKKTIRQLASAIVHSGATEVDKITRLSVLI